MKHALAALVLFVALGVTAVATASNGAATQFKVSYSPDGGTTTWTCVGTHVVNNNVTKDEETCSISGNTTGYVAGTYSGSPFGNFPPYGSIYWQSDFNGARASSWTIRLAANGGGTFTAHIVSLY